MLCKSEQVRAFDQAEGLPKNISIEEFLDEPSGKAERCTKHGVDYLTFETWYKMTHKKVYPVTVTGNPAEDVEIQTEVEKVSR